VLLELGNSIMAVTLVTRALPQSLSGASALQGPGHPGGVGDLESRT